MSRQTLITCTLTLVLGLGAAIATPAQTGPCVDLVPTLTGDSPAVSASGIYSPTYRAWKAFDAAVTGQSMWISEVWETPAWIAYDFETEVVIHRYQITNTNGSLTSRAPMDFTFQGWDGCAWQVLDTRVGETNWRSGTPRTYDVASPGRYSSYRLHVTDDNDARAGVVVISIGDLQFQTCITIFSDSFESGDASSWTTALP